MRKLKKGFTIVELVIVIGVIAILSAILIPTFVSLSGKAKTAKAQQEVASAYSLYASDAIDGVLFDDDEIEGNEIAVSVVYEQSEVLIHHEEGDFVYTDSWKVDDGYVVDNTKHAAPNEDSKPQDPVYNGCTIYVRKAA